MRNSFTRLSIKVIALTFTLSSGTAYARNILPDAFYNPNWLYQGSNTSNRISPIDDNRSYSSGNYLRDYERASRLMALAVKAKDKGNFTEACKLANRALLVISRSSSLRSSAMESDYAAFANEVCEASEKA